MLQNSKCNWYENRTKEKGIRVYDVDQPATEIPNKILSFCLQHVLPFEKDFCIDAIILKGIIKRGNWANSRGWQGQNMIFENIMTVPRHTSMSELDKKIINLMTNIVYSIYSKKLQVVPYTCHKCE